MTFETTLAVLQADLAALRSRMDDMQSNSQVAVDQVKASMRVQLEQQRSEAEEQLQVGWLGVREACAALDVACDS